MKKMVKGELTAFLSLVFILLVSLVGAVLESASIQVMKNERRADATRAMESVFAEYQRDLLDRYEIFALDESYESEQVSESAILNRMSYYGAENMDKEIDAIRYLTDENGKAFYDQAVQYEKEKTGAAAVEEMAGKSSVWKEQESQAEQYEKEDTETRFELERMLEEESQKLPQEGNPLPVVSNIKAGGILNFVLPDGFEVSDKTVDLSSFVSHRELQSGYGSFREKVQGTGDTIFFNLYLMDHFNHAVKKEKESVLQYELEYLLAGKSSDRENLEAVVKKLCSIRFAVNYAYLLTDVEKQAEVQAASVAMCALLAVPGITEVVKQALLLAWAYGEGIVDVKTLLTGKRVPLVKSYETWQLSWENLLHLGEDQSVLEGRDAEGGYSYEKYLQVLLMLEKKEKLTMRALDLEELNLREIAGKTWFRADSCVVALRANMDCGLRRSIHYRFAAEYQYK